LCPQYIGYACASQLYAYAYFKYAYACIEHTHAYMPRNTFLKQATKQQLNKT